MWSAKKLRVTSVIIKRIFGLTLATITLYLAWLEFGKSLIKDLFLQNVRLEIHCLQGNMLREKPKTT